MRFDAVAGFCGTMKENGRAGTGRESGDRRGPTTLSSAVVGSGPGTLFLTRQIPGVWIR